MWRQRAQAFWKWYERHYSVAVGASAGLFLLQILHLFWLTTDVVAQRLVGQAYFEPNGFWTLSLVLVDYLEIPTIISISLIYVNELRKSPNIRAWLYLLLLNSQWIHIFWITDEVVEEIVTGSGQTILPAWAAIVAIMIDYLELPVIADTVRRFIQAARRRAVDKFPAQEN